MIEMRLGMQKRPYFRSRREIQFIEISLRGKNFCGHAVKVVEDFTFEAPKTKQMVALMNNLQVNNGRLLLVLGNGVNENVLLSARNLQNVEVMRVSDIATYNVMKAKNLVLVESSVEGLNEMFNLN